MSNTNRRKRLFLLVKIDYANCFWFIGTGTVSANGGDGSCVDHCSSCDAERRCLQCAPGYFWVGYNCVSSCQDPNNQCCYISNTHHECYGDSGYSTSLCYRGYCNGESNVQAIVSCNIIAKLTVKYSKTSLN